MRNHFVGKPVDLLKCDGSLVEPGWSTKQVWKYDKNAIKSNVFRIKEWDYYLVLAKVMFVLKIKTLSLNT